MKIFEQPFQTLNRVFKKSVWYFSTLERRHLFWKSWVQKSFFRGVEHLPKFSITQKWHVPMYHIFVNIISKVVHSATLKEYLKSHEIFNCYLLLLLYHWNFLRLIGIFQSNTSNTGCYFKCWMVEISLKSNKILCVWWKKIDKKKAERSRSFKHKDFWFESNSTKVFGVPQLLAKLILLFINAFYLSTFFCRKNAHNGWCGLKSYKFVVPQ